MQNLSTSPTFFTSEPYAALTTPETFIGESIVWSVHSPAPVTVSGFGPGLEHMHGQMLCETQWLSDFVGAKPSLNKEKLFYICVLHGPRTALELRRWSISAPTLRAPPPLPRWVEAPNMASTFQRWELLVEGSWRLCSPRFRHPPRTSWFLLSVLSLHQEASAIVRVYSKVLGRHTFGFECLPSCSSR